MSEPYAPAGNSDAVADSPGRSVPGQADPEAPDADTAEQRTPVGEDDLSRTQDDQHARFDVNEADAAEQDRAVDLDEDDYR